jgi:GNAT superfamily N-acetyltransferase
MRSLQDIAAREELRGARSVAEVADEWIEIGGGIASRAAPRSWANTALALGLHGPIGADEVARLVEWYGEKGHAAQIEVCPFAHQSLFDGLNRAGFHIKRFEQVFFRELAAGDGFVAPHALAEGVEIRVVDPRDEGAVLAFARVVAEGFMDFTDPPGQPPTDADIAIMARCARHPLVEVHAAYVRGECVGGGSMEVRDGASALFGLAVRRDWRRRGIQQALIAARLRAARARGAEIATISGLPGEGTERNVRRMGFQLAYTKAIMLRPLNAKSQTPAIVADA